MRGDNFTLEFPLSEVAGDLLSPTNAPGDRETGRVVATGLAFQGLEGPQTHDKYNTESAPASRREQAHNS
jgi:hypothetical protein